MKNNSNKINYFNLFIVTILGFSSGLPLALTSSALQGWLSESNVDIVTIGMLGLVSQPYVYKFLWAPLLDRYALEFPSLKFGYRTGWIFCTQILLGITIIAISFFNPVIYPVYIAVFALFIAFFSATQDIAYDAYRTEILQEHERGFGSICCVYGYRIAMIISGAGSFLLSFYIGWQSTYVIMGFLMIACSIFSLLAYEPKREYKKAMNMQEVLIEPFQEFFSRPSAILILLLLITYKLGEGFATTLTTPFLMQYLSFTTKDIGLIVKTMGLTATIIGIGIGGSIINKLGLYRSLLYFGIMQAVTNLLYYFLAILGHNYYFMAFTILVDQIFGGMGTAVLMVYMMSICNQKYTATQFALLSALATLGRIYVSPISGYYVDAYGWESFFIFSFVASLPCLIIISLLKNKINKHKLLSHNNGKKCLA